MTDAASQIRVQYFSQLRDAAGGADADCVTLRGLTRVEDLIRHLAERHGSGFAQIALDPQGALRPTILCFADGQPVQPGDSLAPGATESLTLISPLGGG